MKDAERKRMSKECHPSVGFVKYLWRLGRLLSLPHFRFLLHELKLPTVQLLRVRQVHLGNHNCETRRDHLSVSVRCLGKFWTWSDSDTSSSIKLIGEILRCTLTKVTLSSANLARIRFSLSRVWIKLTDG